MGDEGLDELNEAHAHVRPKGVYVHIIRLAADDAEKTGSPVDEYELEKTLSVFVRTAVANYEGREYPGLYGANDDEFMHFGTQAIHVPSFVETICDIAETYRIAE